MAAASRDERQLMRQRGAGQRKTSDVDFGFSFGKQQDRAERLLMRQRGAGNRQVSNIEFGFDFHNTRDSRRSASRTPHSGRRRSSRITKTPASRASREPSANRSVRAASADERRVVSEQGGPDIPNLRNASSAKRRRLNDVIAEPPSTRNRKSSGVNFAILEDLEQPSNASINNVLQPSNPTSPMVFQDDNEKENQFSPAENPETAATKKPKKQERRQESAPRRTTRSSLGLQADESISSALQDERETHRSNQIIQVNRIGKGEVNREKRQRDLSGESPPHPHVTQASKKRRKRKLVVLGRKKRRSSGETSTEMNAPEQPVSEPDAEIENTPQESPPLEADTSTQDLEISEATTQPDSHQQEESSNLSLARLRKRSSRLSVSATPEPRDGGDFEDDESYVDEERTPEPITPALKRKPSAKRGSANQATNNKKPEERKASGSSFPILTHRMTNHQALPTIVEDDEQQTEETQEEDSRPEMFKDRAAPNAVDVLAQICRETVETAIEQLEGQTATAQNRAQIRGKRTALEAFGQELDQRLFDMSEAVEYRHTLEARLRKAKREKSELQARWIEVRRQRDEIALRADAIRRQNWENEEETNCRWEVSELAHKTEMQLESEAPAIGLEFMLRQVAGLVSNAHGGLSLLGQVRSFNAQLERVAAGLERRR